MDKIYMQEELIKLADIRGLAARKSGQAVVIKDESGIYADVVYRDDGQYFRAAHRDGKEARVFSSVETAARALINAGLNDVVLKYLDTDRKPQWLHLNYDEVAMWEQKLDALGPNAPIEELRQHLAVAPSGAPSGEFLLAFMEGYDRAKKDGNK